MVGGTVGTVVESKHRRYRPGDVVVGDWGWQEYQRYREAQEQIAQWLAQARCSIGRTLSMGWRTLPTRSLACFAARTWASRWCAWRSRSVPASSGQFAATRNGLTGRHNSFKLLGVLPEPGRHQPNAVECLERRLCLRVPPAGGCLLNYCSGHFLRRWE